MMLALLQKQFTSLVVGVAAASSVVPGPPIVVSAPIEDPQAIQVSQAVAGDQIEQEEIITAPTPEQVQEEIVAQAAEYGVNVQDALRIARCESTFRYNAKNPHSSAKGVYQFIDGTWEWIGAEGHQFDYKENITQFMIWYQRYPSWWECR